MYALSVGQRTPHAPQLSSSDMRSTPHGNGESGHVTSPGGHSFDAHHRMPSAAGGGAADASLPSGPAGGGSSPTISGSSSEAHERAGIDAAATATRKETTRAVV